MIRLLIYLVVFLLGGAGAMAWFGEMRHVRQAVPDQLPKWTALIEDDARVFDGSATWGVPGLPNLNLAWQGAQPDGDGLHWDLVGAGPGLQVRADLNVPFWPETAFVAGGKGTLSVKELSGGVADGLVRIDDITGEIPLLNRGNRGPGFIEIKFASDPALPAAVRQALSAYGELGENTLRIPVALP